MSQRLTLIDALRGFAVVMMIVYHFCFDLVYFGWAKWAMLTDPAWISWRNAIVTTFLLVSGISLGLRSLAQEPLPAWVFRRVFMRRWLQVAGAALLVSAGSAMMFPASFIYFGVLHFVAVALLLGSFTAQLRAWNVLLGAAVLGAGWLFSSDAFNPTYLNWIGFATKKPFTEDYVPLVPWLGVFFIGLGITPWAARIAQAWAKSPKSAITTSALNRLSLLGRYSLSIYLLHQPVIIAALACVKKVLG